MAKTKELTTGRPFRLILNFTIPVLLGYVLQQTYSLIDAILLGRFVSLNGLASVGVSSSVLFLILGFCSGCATGFAIPVAQKFGAHDYSLMRRFYVTGLRLSILISAVLAVVTCLLCHRILHWLSTPQEIFGDAYIYLFITFVGIPCTFLYNLLASVIRALGNSKVPLYFLLLSTVLNIVLDLFCILVLRMGVAGAAVATVVAQGLSALLCYIYMRKRFGILRATPEECRRDPAIASSILAIGVPMGLQFSITAIGSIMLQSSNNALGTVCVAAYTVAFRIKMFFMCPFDALGTAMAIFAGQNYGAGLPQRIRLGLKDTLLMVVIYTVVAALILAVGIKWLALLFVSPTETEVIDKAALYTYFNISFYLALGSLIVLRNTIQGLGFTAFAMYSGVAEMVARIAVSLFVVPALGFLGVCMGDPLAWVFACTFLVPAFVYVYSKIRDIRPVNPAAS